MVDRGLTAGMDWSTASEITINLPIRGIEVILSVCSSANTDRDQDLRRQLVWEFCEQMLCMKHCVTGAALASVTSIYTLRQGHWERTVP